MPFFDDEEKQRLANATPEELLAMKELFDALKEVRTAEECQDLLGNDWSPPFNMAFGIWWGGTFYGIWVPVNEGYTIAIGRCNKK